MKIWNTFVVVAGLFLLGTSSAWADASRYAGTYKPKGDEFSNWDCKSVGQDGGALQVTADTFRGVESQCQLSKPVQVNGMNATLFDAQCAAEGDEWTERIMFMLSERGIYYIRDGFAGEWERCQPGAM